eukprot:jgi/Astpho2/4994/fgenesh1_pg.00070_%23_46_t
MFESRASQLVFSACGPGVTWLLWTWALRPGSTHIELQLHVPKGEALPVALVTWLAVTVKKVQRLKQEGALHLGRTCYVEPAMQQPHAAAKIWDYSYIVVMTSRSRPFTVLLLLQLLPAASLMQPPALVFVLMAQMLPDVTAGICVDDTSLTPVGICLFNALLMGALKSIRGVLSSIVTACVVVQVSSALGSRPPLFTPIGVDYTHARPAGSHEGICLPPCTRAQLLLGERLMCSRLLRAGSRHHLHGKCPEVHIKTFLFWFLYWCCMERPSSQQSG